MAAVSGLALSADPLHNAVLAARIPDQQAWRVEGFAPPIVVPAVGACSTSNKPYEGAPKQVGRRVGASERSEQSPRIAVPRSRHPGPYRWHRHCRRGHGGRHGLAFRMAATARRLQRPRRHRCGAKRDRSRRSASPPPDRAPRPSGSAVLLVAAPAPSGWVVAARRFGAVSCPALAPGHHPPPAIGLSAIRGRGGGFALTLYRSNS